MLQNVIPWGTPLQDTFEIWEQRRPVMGDHIRVQRYHGLYAHHGIYVSDEEVIHFTGTDDDSILDWSKCKVIRTDLERFLDGAYWKSRYIRRKNWTICIPRRKSFNMPVSG